MKYCVKMRASRECEGIREHLSGAERIVEENQVEAVMQSLFYRATHHAKGKPDAISMKVELRDEEDIQHVPALSVEEVIVNTPSEGHAVMVEKLLMKSTMTEEEANQLVALLVSLENMRGAVLYDVATHTRLEKDFMRGVRLSNMDMADSVVDQAGTKCHYQEALVLATKAMNAPGVIAELCISDDPDYQIGYIATPDTYLRISQVKELGSSRGGRILVVDASRMDVTECIQYLEKQTVLVHM